MSENMKSGNDKGLRLITGTGEMEPVRKQAQIKGRMFQFQKMKKKGGRKR